MAITVTKTFCTSAPIDKVWALLSDPMQVVTCIPGAQITGQVNFSTYKGSVQMKMGASVSNYTGTVQILRVDQNAHEIEIFGKGKDAGGRGSASLKMTGKVRSLPDGSTEITGISEMNVIGLVAQMGSRVFGQVADFMFNEFTKNVQERLGKPK